MKWAGWALALVWGMGHGFHASAATVTTPAGTITGANDAAVTDAWYRTNVRSGGTTGITADYPRSGNGSAYLYGIGTGSPSPDKADWKYVSSAPTGFGPLSQLTALSYDWYRDGSSTVPDHFHPSVRITLQDATDPAIRRRLIFELAYNPAVAPVATNAWVTQPVTDASVVWNTGNSYPTLGACKAATAATDCDGVLGSDLVIGLEFGIGSGWARTATEFFKGAVDNVVLTMNGQEVLNANFELPPQATVACAPPTLSDATAEVSTCTVTLTAAASAGGLPVTLTPPTADARFTTTCASPITFAEGQTTATCTITSVANTAVGDGDAVVTLALAEGTGYVLGTPSSATVTIQDKSVATPSPTEPRTPVSVPTLSEFGLAALAAALGASAMVRRRRRKA